MTICWFYRWAVLISTRVGWFFIWGEYLKNTNITSQDTHPYYLLINQCKLERFWTTGGGFNHIWWKGISNLSTVMQVMFFNWIGLRGPPTSQPTHQPTNQPTLSTVKTARLEVILYLGRCHHLRNHQGLASRRNPATFLPTRWSFWWQSAKVKPFWKIQFVLVLWFVKMLQVYMSHEYLMNVLFWTCPNSQ